MAYLKTIYEPNGDIETPIDFYTCDITGIEINEMHGWFGNDKIHISEEGVEILIEQLIERTKNGFFPPMFLVYLFERYTKRVKPDRYIPKEMKQAVLEKYQHTCNYCGNKENLEIDHIKPVTKGGISEIKNLQVLCKPCNIKKSNKYDG